MPEKTDQSRIVKIPVCDYIDLHTFAPSDIPSVVEEYLGECRARGILTVRVIHGKGTGFQRDVVSRVLKNLSFVKSYRTAPPDAGGWGATIVNLKKKK